MAVSIGTGTPTRSLAVPGVPGTGGTSASWTLSGANLGIFLSIATFDGTNTQTVSVVSWSLGSGTPIQVGETSRGGGSHIFLWVIPAPTAGAGTYTVTLSQSQQYQITATYFTGCHQTTPAPVGDIVTVNVDGSPATLTPTNLTANDASYGGGGSDSNDPSGVTPNETYSNNTTAINLQAGYATGVTGVTFAWTAVGAGQAIAVTRIAEAATSPITLAMPVGGVAASGTGENPYIVNSGQIVIRKA